jgi:mono/diheme cytochrome c family protein
MTTARYRHLLLIAALAGADAGAAGQVEREQSRGELLYTTHCIACHTTQMHWREQRLATDWPSLVKQVRRWQDTALLSWDEQDINAVANYLNTLYYHFPTSRQDKAISRNTEEHR